ncbi:MAG: CDP-alcohol phosphatidyltransferase family protein [Planctomycetota bacterium]
MSFERPDTTPTGRTERDGASARGYPGPFGRTRRRLIGISVLPAAATLGNLICGFLAILYCFFSIRAEYGGAAPKPRMFDAFDHLFPTHIAAGVYLVVLAMFFDALDGRLARMTRRTSEFGAQLDSLSDVVSFGAAPVALFIAVLLRPPEGGIPPVPLPSLQFRVGLVCALIYLAGAAIRLARYNVENIKTEAAQKAFSGLPSPGAAAAVVALLALHEHVRSTQFELWGVDWPAVLRWCLAGTACAAGLLMISRLDYVHVFNIYFRRKRPPAHLVWLIVVLGIGWYSFELLLVALAFGYLFSGIVISIGRWAGWLAPAAAVGGSAERPAP